MTGVRIRDRRKTWDDEAIQRLAQAIELAVMDSNRDRAHYLVDAFFDEAMKRSDEDGKQRATLDVADHVAQLVSPDTSGLLEAAGFITIGSVLYAKDAELLAINEIGRERLLEIREALVLHKFSPPTVLHTILRKGQHRAKVAEAKSPKRGVSNVGQGKK